ncbi:uncharacterized protein LOC126887310 isoform X2 [Diabrotica virgifera virgifera]|uniref:Uncharacterized protein n=2 Tax=Diabrotica virgifera virgifera TaxID=50390 RepID=A0ABM5KKM1_DIAVI|nr:uncharacterized protein LOC126887310 isoform X2 [Diabrotica virgifera virgifera]
MAGSFKSIHLPTVLLVLVAALHNGHSATLTDVLLSDESNKPQEISSDEFIPPLRLSRDVKYPRYAADNTDKDLKPEDSPDRDRDSGSAPPGKRCISCFASYPQYSNNPSYDRNRYYYDDRSRDRDYDRYDDRDRDRYNERDRYDRYNDRDRYYSRGRDRYGDRDRYYDPYDYDRYDPYERYDRYGDRQYDRYDRDRYDTRYSDRGIGYDNKGYDYRINDPYNKGNDDYNRGYSGRPDYGTSGYASKWNYGSSGGGRDDYYSRDRYPSYRPVSKDTYNRDPYNDTYRPTSYLYGRPSSTTPKPSSGDSNTQSPQGSSG